jgi:hypothetical protein
LAKDLATVRLELQPHKSKCYIDEQHRDDRWNELQGIIIINNGTVEDEDGNVHYGITTCNIPIGSESFVKTYLNKKMNSILKGTTSISNLLNPGRWPHPNIPMQQMLWILTLICMQFMGNYWLRHVCPDYTADFAQGLDKSIHTIFQMCIGIDINSWTDFAKERMQLLIRFKGLGLQASFNRCHTQYIGALTQSIPYLINQTDSNNTIQGRLNIQSIVNLLGED